MFIKKKKKKGQYQKIKNKILNIKKKIKNQNVTHLVSNNGF